MIVSKPLTQIIKQRKCKHHGCRTILSTYNLNPVCYMHISKSAEEYSKEHQNNILERIGNERKLNLIKMFYGGLIENDTKRKEKLEKGKKRYAKRNSIISH